jgi:GAF domain-containing protein
MQPPIPSDEDVRLRTLHALNILDSAPEADFDDIVALASEICGAPISLVSLVDADRQWFKAKIGVAVDETHRELSFCAHAIVGGDLMIVPDAAVDARFADHPFVQAVPGVRFYAGAPLRTDRGSALGTLCVVDHQPHRLTVDQIRALRSLAHQVSQQLELRRRVVAPETVAPSDPRAVDLAYLLEAQVRELRPIGEARGMVVTFAIAGEPLVLAGPGPLAQALGYVMFTALKAAPAGGRVAVRVTDHPAPTVEIGHSGGSIVPAWHADLAGQLPAAEPVPAAAADVLRGHGAAVETTSEPLGSPDVRFELRFPPH